MANDLGTDTSSSHNQHSISWHTQMDESHGVVKMFSPHLHISQMPQRHRLLWLKATTWPTLLWCSARRPLISTASRQGSTWLHPTAQAQVGSVLTWRKAPYTDASWKVCFEKRSRASATAMRQPAPPCRSFSRSPKVCAVFSSTGMIQAPSELQHSASGMRLVCPTLSRKRASTSASSSSFRIRGR